MQFCGAADEIKILVIAVEPLKLELAEPKEICANGEKLEKFLSLFFCRPDTKIRPRLYHEFDFDAPEKLSAGTLLMLPKNHRVGCLKVPAQSLNAVDRERFFSAEEIILLSNVEAVTLERDAQVELVAAEKFFAERGTEIFIVALKSEQKIFCREYSEHFRREDELAAERPENFVRSKKLIRHNSYGELLNAVENRQCVARAEDKYQPSIVQAVREIGNFLGVPRERIRLSAESCNLQDLREILRLLATTCGQCGRSVELDNDWYRQDLGALLIFREGKPFASLPRRAEPL